MEGAGSTGGDDGPTLTASFTYDALGRRTSKTVNGHTTHFTYDGDDIVAEVDSQAGLVTYVRGLSIDEPFVRQTSSGTEFYHADGLGSTLAFSDDAGTTTTRYSYDPFGKTTVTGASTNAFQYTSRENDGTALYYYRARYYSPTFHRFISEDPIGLEGGDENFYAYTFNSPTNFTDPSGEVGFLAPLLPPAVACIRGAGSSLLADALSGRKPNLTEAALGCVTGGANKVFSAAKAAGKAAGKGLLGKNARGAFSRTNTDLPGGRATAKSIFRNQTQGHRTLWATRNYEYGSGQSIYE
ncbi:MAG: hypothetical protein H0W49_01320 [Nitrospirales bacterium]|nr:hypothetical protein [Nitrospirales bacterium]